MSSAGRRTRPDGLWPARVLVTDVDGVNHLIYDTVLTEVTDGRFRAVCGSMLFAAPLSGREGTDDCALCRVDARPGRQPG